MSAATVVSTLRLVTGVNVARAHISGRGRDTGAKDTHEAAPPAAGEPEQRDARPSGPSDRASAPCAGDEPTPLTVVRGPMCLHTYGVMVCIRETHVHNPRGHVYVSSDGSATPDRHHEPEEG